MAAAVKAAIIAAKAVATERQKKTAPAAIAAADKNRAVAPDAADTKAAAATRMVINKTTKNAKRNNFRFFILNVRVDNKKNNVNIALWFCRRERTSKTL